MLTCPINEKWKEKLFLDGSASCLICGAIIIKFIILLLLVIIISHNIVSPIVRREAKGDWDFRISYLVKNPDGTDI